MPVVHVYITQITGHIYSKVPTNSKVSSRFEHQASTSKLCLPTHDDSCNAVYSICGQDPHDLCILDTTGAVAVFIHQAYRNPLVRGWTNDKFGVTKLKVAPNNG